MSFRIVKCILESKIQYDGGVERNLMV